jgi:hypothetical protein
METRDIILSPGAATGQAATSSSAPLALESLAGKVVGVIDNSKQNFNLLADDLTALLVERYGAAGVVKHRKRTASEPASEEVFRDLAARCDLVIAGSGD